MLKNLEGMYKSYTFALAFGKQASFRSAEAPAGRQPQGGRTAVTELMTNRELQKKVEQKFGGFKILFYLCKVFPPDGSQVLHTGARAEAGRKIPEDIERLTIDKDKKVQELKRRQV